MVVTRKAPLPPTPSSRSSSSQTVPRMAKVKVNQLNQPEHSSPLANGRSKLAESADFTTTSKSKPKSRWRRKSTPKPKKGIFKRFIGFLFKAYLAWLTVYWFLICQNPHQASDSSICRTISTTHYNIVEPYAYPLVKQALSHPTVEPYVREIEPYVIRAHRLIQPVAATAVSKFSAYVIPEWNNRVVPQYHAYVAPHVQNALEHLDPYLAIVGTEYERYLAPYVRLSGATAWKLQELAQPYVILAWHRSVDGYRCAKPYARPAWEWFKAAVFRSLAYLAAYRKQLVDPHVAQMWAKIKELSGEEVVPTKAMPAVTPQPVPVVGIPVDDSSTAAAIFAGENAPSPVPAPALTPPPLLNNDENQPPQTPRVTASIPEAMSVLGDGPTDPVDVHVLAESEATLQEEAYGIPHSPEQEPAPVVPSVDETPSPVPAHTPEQVVPDPSAADQDDFESFSNEIGLDLDDPVETPEQEIPPAPPVESDEEREARAKAKAEETAWKRKEITDRHTDWEYQLEDLKREQMEIFKLALYNVRKTSAKMLKKESSVQLAIDEFAADGDRYLRGAESYLKNLIKEKKQDKGALWGRVVQKVEDKFEKRLDDVDRKVGNWYNEVVANEEQLVEKAATIVSEFSQKAQVDLGLDYSWLDDVTVDDWTRYHDLMRSSDSFREDVLMVRNGTHPESLQNPVFRALKELRVEVDDIITGFKSRLRRVQRDGERAFEVANHDEEQKSKPDGDSPVSILPIAEESIPQVTIGKSPEQVMEALKEVPLEEWAASKGKNPNEVRTHEEL